MGNLGTKKKQREQDENVTDDVWLKLNDGKLSPKSKKKKKKKRKKKGKRDSPDRPDESASQCDSYSYSTLSSRKLSDDTIASTGTLTQQHANNDAMYTTRDAKIADDQSNGSIGYVTASDTFTPPSPRKGRQPKFSPVIAQNSPRVVRRLLQSDKIVQKEQIPENQNEPFENLSPRAKFFLSTPETNKSTAFESRKYNRHSSGSSIDSKTFLGVPEDYKLQACAARGNDNRYVTNGSLIAKARQKEDKNSIGHVRLSNNSLEMSDSTTENLLKTGEKAKLIRYDSGNMSPAERRKNKQNTVNTATKGKLSFLTFNTKYPQRGIIEDSTQIIATNNRDLKSISNDNKNETTGLISENNLLSVDRDTDKESVPPPSPASGVNILEIDESESCSEKHLSKEDEIFGDIVCKRLSLLLESEQDKTKLDRSEFHEFTDSPCSSPDIPKIPEIVFNDVNFDGKICHNEKGEGRPETLNHNLKIDEASKLNSSVKTPQGRENASVLDVMNNNFRMKANEEIIIASTAQTVDREEPNENCINKRFCQKETLDIDEQMRYENEINEKLIEEKVKTLNEILQPQAETSKRSSIIFSVNNKHGNDPDNYILVTRKTYCVKRGVLVELMDEEKDVITRDVTEILNRKSDWVTTACEEKYKPETMNVEQGQNVVCPEYNKRMDSELEFSGSVSEPDYVNIDDFERPERDSELEDFERNERQFDETPSSEEEIDFENILNRSQSQSDSEGSDTKPKRESDILCEVISAYKDEDNSDYSDVVSEEEIQYCDEPRTERNISVIRTPSKLDKSLQKIFQEKAKQLALAAASKPDEHYIDDFVENDLPNESYDKIYANGDNSPSNFVENAPTMEAYAKSSNEDWDSYALSKSLEGRRRSLTYTESDLDTSEKWDDDDDDASNDSMLADDEGDDDEVGEIIFSKPYLEHDEKADALFSYNLVQTIPDSPFVWEPEPEDDNDDDVFQNSFPFETGVYHPDDSLESSDEAFDDARKQMQEIHEQLQTLREQMVTFEHDEDSSLPTSPLHDQVSHFPKADTD